MKKDSEVLSDVRFALTPKEHWTQRAWALSKHKNSVEYMSKNAVCWCLGGAIRAAGGWPPLLEQYFAVSGSLLTYNDRPRRTHAQILNQLDRAIEKALKLEEINETDISS